MKRKRSGGGAGTVLALLIGALMITGLLFLAPQWLLVVLVLILAGAVIALARARS